MFQSGTRYYCFTKDWFQPRVTTPFFSPLSGRRPRTAADVNKINKINGVVQGPAVKDDCDILETWGWLKPWHLTCTVYRDSNLESFGWHWNPTFPHKECVTCAGTITLKPPWHKIHSSPDRHPLSWNLKFPGLVSRFQPVVRPGGLLPGLDLTDFAGGYEALHPQWHSVAVKPASQRVPG